MTDKNYFLKSCVVKTQLFFIAELVTFKYNVVMEILNIWLIKAQEAKLLKIVRWASANNKRIKDLTEEEIATAIRSHY